ncbi:acyl-CoA ligase (AMP-forming), exosortase A system-associated [Halieaceae bacterium IMCC14734]|uniref:Acyl-CoA ligase (AMP-forming), exosortase A system-associated n=1 Tax=Candidatus Litorirhabdus singularis TaxID=2518993 RepID=A0ABT3TG37_9GAMM|nr:acyl-CoA ligase (AMP-forming), exosortase A system-associated [Candidatus Litorirhabdus singularis]MCX2981268.1 acyl-CoA ligase (AMP-forming), exosortase A system-associated [Candidatus Litorirhabdus singularis]
MSELIHEFIRLQAEQQPDAVGLYFKQDATTYADLWSQVIRCATGFKGLGLQPGQRVGVYLPKIPQSVYALFGAAAADLVFVPINPLLKPAQVAYILRDCNVTALVTADQRLTQLESALAACEDLKSVITIEDAPLAGNGQHYQTLGWTEFSDTGEATVPQTRRIDADVAAILYTSGSTGNPKGVVLSHRNMVTGAKSVADYLHNTRDDVLLAVLPLSFDYGLSQLTTTFCVGAGVVLMDYLLPRDVIKAVARHGVTGLAAVPPLWQQLATLEWPTEAQSCLRYITNSGGAMPPLLTQTLQKALPDTSIFLMYGLTEAFRSTYLPPEQIAVRPDSMGKAIPNAEIMVVREDGSPCEPGEAGELVHRGALVALGYWRDEEKTAQRFRPAPGQPPELPLQELAVWSGDEVTIDEEGYLYFVSRKDEMIKTSGYRVSPTEVEDVLYQSKLISEAVALGIQHPDLGQAIVLVASCAPGVSAADLTAVCTKELPNFMLPRHIEVRAELPRNPNGKIDRAQLAREFANYFMSQESQRN